MATESTPNPNIVGDLLGDEEERREFGQELVRKVDQDILDRADWETKRARWLDLHMMQPKARKLPWDGAANVVYPLMAAADLQFQARSYSSLFEQPYPERVKVRPVSPDDGAKAKNVGHLLNWQLIVEMEEYEAEWDRMLSELPIFGCSFTKLWWCSQDKRPKLKYVPAADVIVPYRTDEFKDARRVTHRLWQHIDDIRELGEEGFYANVDTVLQANDEDAQRSPIHDSDDRAQGSGGSDQEEERNIVYEVHTKAKLGGADKREPVTIWVEKTSGEVLRVVKRMHRIDGEDHVLDQWQYYQMFPNPEGFYGLGYGHFLESLNDIQNTLYNLYIDGSRITNTPMGFAGRGSGLRHKQMKVEPAIIHHVNDASQVVFPKLGQLDANMPTLLGLTKQAGQEISSNSEELRGGSSVSRDPTVRGTLARIEQGLVSFGVIIKRLARMQKTEIRRIYMLDRLFLPEDKVFRILGRTDDTGFVSLKKDDLKGKFDFYATADPAFSSPQQRRAEAAQLTEIIMTIPGVAPTETSQGNPVLLAELLRDLFRTFAKPELTLYLPEPPEPPLPPDVENQRIREGEEVSVKRGEPHEQHLIAHRAEAAENDSEALQAHIREHEAMAVEEIQAQRNADLMAAAAGQAGGGAGNGAF